MKPPVVMLDQLTYFVGRREVLESIKGSLKDKGCLYLDFVEGIEGIGKTTLLIKLFSDLQLQKEFYPVWVCMTVFDPLRKGRDSNPESIAALANNLNDYRQLLQELAGELNDPAFEGYESFVDEIFQNRLAELLHKDMKVDLKGVTIKTGDIHVGAFSRLAEGQFKTGNVVVKVPDHQMRLVIDHLREKLTAEFVKRANQFQKSTRCVILLDNFQLVLNDQVGEWFLTGVVSQLKNAVVVLAKTQTPSRIQLSNSALICLGNFSLGDVRDYLEKKFKDKSFPPQLADRIYTFSGGHPQAVVLAVDACITLQKKGVDEKQWLDVFNDVPKDHLQKIIKLVEQIQQSINDQDVTDAFEIGWVLRRFDADILQYLLSHGQTIDDQEKRFTNLISRLEEYSFTENHGEYYKFHDFIRRGMEDRLIKNDPKRHAQIHHLAAQYYSEKLIDYDNEREDESSYMQWFRYESYEWQCLIAEWLYHLKHTPQRDQAVQHFIRVYFDAFWWWGAYDDFPFCERLLSEWRRVDMPDADREWFRLVEKFHLNFPTGYLHKEKGNWTKVKMALCSLRRQAKLEAPLETLDSNRRHVRAITDVFLSNAYAGEDPQSPDAEKFLLEAVKLFEQEQDGWNVNWALYYLSDLYCSRGKTDQALMMARRAHRSIIEPAVDERDYEIIAKMHGIFADAAWQMQQLDNSVHHYALAVASSYLYHGVPGPVDPYTVKLQKEMMYRTCSRLLELWQSGCEDDAYRYALSLRDFFSEYRKLTGDTPSLTRNEFETWLVGHQDNTSLYEHLFPRLPQDEEINQAGNDYVDEIHYLLKTFAPLLAVDHASSKT